MKKWMTFLLAITFFSVTGAYAQYRAQGTVVDQNNLGVIGATVLQQGTGNVTITDMDGKFSLTVPSAETLLEISYMGYKTLTVQAQYAANVVMEEDAAALEEVVIIGYGTVKKSDMTGSVAAVKADQINKGVVTTPSDLLRGKTAGVVITSGDGQPGSAATIRVRGGSSLSATNDPLIVVDGLPISNAGIGGMTDQLSSINPSDIESFTVLKDASATAIYGSRASNGVIIITTKKGSRYAFGAPKVAVDFTTSLSQNTKFLDVMTGDEMRLAMLSYAGYQSAAYEALGTANTDWQKEIFQLAQSYDVNASVTGSTKLGKKGATLPYRVSAGFIAQEGTLKTSSMNRSTLSFNLNPSFLKDHLTVSLNGKGMIINNRFANTGAIGGAIEYDPTQEVYDSSPNGLDGYRIWGTNGMANTQASSNPVATLEQYTEKAIAKRFIGNAQIDYKIHGFEDLRLNLNLGLDISASEGTKDTPVGSEQSYHSQLQSGSGYHEDYNKNKRDATLEAYANYTKNIGKHFVDVMGGYSWQHFYYDSDYLGVKQSDRSQVLQGSPSKSEYYLVSFFGRANYGFDNRYLITGTVRRDGTSRFSNNKWGLFPSVAASWNAKNEAFLKSSKTLSALKLRLSWGQTGQQDLNAGDYPTLPKYKNSLTGSYYQFGDRVIIPITPLGYNSDLKWETTTTYNAGIDLGFLNDRITASVDVYYRETTDLLNYTPVAAGANLANYLDANIGSLENKGIELEMNFIPLQSNDWYWTLGANVTYNQNKITKLTTSDGPGYTGVSTGGISGGVGNNIQRYMVGEPVNTFYVFEQIYDAYGNPIMGAYVDRNGDGTINASDMYCYKKAAPDFTFGFNTTVNWKNWTLAASAHASLGNYMYDNNSSRLELLSDLWTNNFVANRMSSAMRTGFTKAQYFSDHYVKDASFFKLDNVTLGYQFKLGSDMGLNVFGTVQNVMVITPYDGIDPEIFNGIDNHMYPRPRTYILGVKFNF